MSNKRRYGRFALEEAKTIMDEARPLLLLCLTASCVDGGVSEPCIEMSTYKAKHRATSFELVSIWLADVAIFTAFPILSRARGAIYIGIFVDKILRLVSISSTPMVSSPTGVNIY